MLHNDIEHLMSQALQQRKAVAVHMTDNLLGNGAVIERRSDLVTVDCLCRIVSQAYINDYILLVVYFLFLNAYVGSQQQILYLYSCLVVAGNFCHTASIRLSQLAIAADQIEKLCACCLRLAELA